MLNRAFLSHVVEHGAKEETDEREQADADRNAEDGYECEPVFCCARPASALRHTAWLSTIVRQSTQNWPRQREHWWDAGTPGWFTQ